MGWLRKWFPPNPNDYVHTCYKCEYEPRWTPNCPEVITPSTDLLEETYYTGTCFQWKPPQELVKNKSMTPIGIRSTIRHSGKIIKNCPKWKLHHRYY